MIFQMVVINVVVVAVVMKPVKLLSKTRLSNQLRNGILVL